MKAIINFKWEKWRYTYYKEKEKKHECAIALTLDLKISLIFYILLFCGLFFFILWRQSSL